MDKIFASTKCLRLQCPSDSAEWEPINGIVNIKGNPESKIVGSIFTCIVCSIKWINTPEAGDFIPEASYWKSIN